MERKSIRRGWAVGAGVVLGALMVSPASAFWGSEFAPAYDGACGSSCDVPCDSGAPCDVGGKRHRIGHAFVDYLETGRYANAMWPYPYVCPDRVWAVAPFEVMVNNGWRRQNLLGAHHFDSTTGKLTRAGELKVEWILTQTPPSRRQVFVERAVNDEITQARIATAQTFASNINSVEGEALVQETHIRSPRRPANMVDSERSSFIESRPPAVLPAGSRSTAAASN